jgi:uncharacterized protein YndB with AHSA1/START domain
MLWIIVLVVAAAIAILLLKAAGKPPAFSIQRATDINAPPEKIFALINDFHGWLLWSPWEGIDPTLKRTYGGPASVPGTTYAWEGDKKVGTGRMEITQSVPASKIVIKLDFLKPFEAHNVTTFTLAPHGSATNVVWTMTGQQSFMLRLISTFFDMDKSVGGDFARGLAKLKTEAEK